MGYVDLIPEIFRLSLPDIATGETYRSRKFNVGNKQCIGVTLKASQALSVSVAYGTVDDTAATAGIGTSASLPFKTSATSFASSTGTEGGTYHELAIPPHARQAQLVISNASGSTVSGAVCDAALRVVAYPASGGGGGSSAFGDITGWPGASTDFIRGDGSDAPLTAGDIPNHSADLLTSGTVPVARIPTAIPATSIGGGAVSNTEFGYLDGVTSAIQTQLGAKWGTPTGTANNTQFARGDGAFADTLYGVFRLLTSGVLISGTTFTTVAGISIMTKGFLTVYVNGMGGARLHWDGSTLSVWKSLADTNIVAAASAGAGEFAFRISGGNLQASNNTGAGKYANCLFQIGFW